MGDETARAGPGEPLSKTQAFESNRHFREGRESVEDHGNSERPQTSCANEIIEKVSTVVREAKSASQAEFRPKNGFQKCFDDIDKGWQKCVVA
ncbi:hypothetical protein TNCV_3883121 [Trichonephila clavipes]|nr:hypothetical protein TNCV_3883121 [Trichonephila clavipes]